MQTYHFKEIVNGQGEVTLSGLPPFTEVAIVVIKPEPFDWQERMNNFMDKLQENHPLAKMSQEDILIELRKTREKVYDELYGDRHAN